MLLSVAAAPAAGTIVRMNVALRLLELLSCVAWLTPATDAAEAADLRRDWRC